MIARAQTAGVGVRETRVRQLPRVDPRLTLWKHRSVPETAATVRGPQHRLRVTACKRGLQQSLLQPLLRRRKVGIHTLSWQDCGELTKPGLLENAVGRTLAPRDVHILIPEPGVMASCAAKGT